MTAVQFAHVGMNNLVQLNRVIAVLSPGTRTVERYLEISKNRGQFIDVSRNRKFRSILLLDDGTVIASCISVMTLLKRFYNTAQGEGIPTNAEMDDAEDLIDFNEEDDRGEDR